MAEGAKITSAPNVTAFWRYAEKSEAVSYTHLDVYKRQEKDALRDEYGIVSCAKAQLADLPAEAVCGVEQSPYGARVLVRRALVSSAFQIERANIEDIILFLVKGEKNA